MMAAAGGCWRLQAAARRCTRRMKTRSTHKGDPWVLGVYIMDCMILQPAQQKVKGTAVMSGRRLHRTSLLHLFSPFPDDFGEFLHGHELPQPAVANDFVHLQRVVCAARRRVSAREIRLDVGCKVRGGVCCTYSVFKPT